MLFTDMNIPMINKKPKLYSIVISISTIRNTQLEIFVNSILNRETERIMMDVIYLMD